MSDDLTGEIHMTVPTDWESVAADQALTIALLESEIIDLKNKLNQSKKSTLAAVYGIIDQDQERYCNLTNGGSVDYNDFIDCLENLKQTLIEDLENEQA